MLICKYKADVYADFLLIFCGKVDGIAVSGVCGWDF